MTRCPRCDTHAASHRPDRLCSQCYAIVHDQESPKVLTGGRWVRPVGALTSRWVSDR